jgi:hypothetical protein
MNARLLRLPAIAVLACGAGLGCGVEPVVVAERADGGVNTPCTSNDTCSPDLFCSRPSPSTCQSPPALCDDRRVPVCGSDGVNYWNDCLRMHDRVSASTPGLCTDAGTPCSGPRGAPCPGDSFCGNYNEGDTFPCPSFPQAGPGLCWVLPTSCARSSQQEAGASGEAGSTDDAGVQRDNTQPQRTCKMPLSCSDFCAALRQGPGEFIACFTGPVPRP